MSSASAPPLRGHHPLRLGFLGPTQPLRVHVPILSGILGIHLLALLAFVPWLFSWSALACMIAGTYFFGMLGINIGFHRLVTHRAFACPLWLEHSLAVLGACCGQGSPMSWVATHRIHHQHSDGPRDPHSPRASFLWSHMGWFLFHDPAIFNFGMYDHYARDLFQDPFYKVLERPRVWGTLHAAQWAVHFGVGALIGSLTTGTLIGAVQLGLSWLVWGVFVRMVLVWHVTWSVNSLTHLWGYRNFDTRDDSRNNWLVGLLSHGEGWHNNHHAEPRCAAHGRRWWELDTVYLTICSLERLGLAWDLVKPSRRPPKVLIE